jgi:hypothetical protein
VVCLAVGLALLIGVMARGAPSSPAAAGDAATSVALAALGSTRPRTIGLGADVIGECGLSLSVEIVAAVAGALDRLEAVIAAATEPLAKGKSEADKKEIHKKGKGGKPGEASGKVGDEYGAVQACVQCLGNLAQRVATATHDQQSVVYNALATALLPHVSSESDAVRRKAAEAMMPLCNVSPSMSSGADAAANAALVKALWRSLDDPNRYVIASGAEGLVRLAGSGLRRGAAKAALANLVDKRWCPVTTGTSQF